MGRKEEMAKKVQAMMGDLDHIRNIGICAHIDHGKTTLSDSLLAGAGLISQELAGRQLALDFDEQEQARGITINAAAASMVHTYNKQDYLINLIDTPGHVDFGGDVTRAMRALDGAIVVVCAVEGPMPQTETVVRQALKERVRPILFINKVDRLINELKVTPEQMQERFIKLIAEVNRLIGNAAPPEFKKEWVVKVDDGTVLFGSAFHKWAISVPMMKKTGITFKDIYNYCAQEDQKTLAGKAPTQEVILDSVVLHHPSPKVAQKYRIPAIWRGPADSAAGKAMLECDAKGPLSVMVTKIILDPHGGEVAVGRIYSGSVRRGDQVYVSGMPKSASVQTVAINLGADRLPVEFVNAGSIVAISGVRTAISGSTITSDPEIEAFEKITHHSEPVVTVAVEAKHTRDLPKLVEVMRAVAKADPSIVVEINQETGEHLMSGMGELHLDITQYRIINEHKVEIKASEPIVVYRENVRHAGGPFEGKSPNKHNRFFILVEPMSKELVDAIRSGQIEVEEKKIRDPKSLGEKLVALGWDRKESRNVKAFHGRNMFVDDTKGIQNLHETMELVIDAFREAIDQGPLANERVDGLLVRLKDAKLHEDSIHRGPGQVIPAVRSSIYGAMCLGERILLEPKQRVFITVPQNVMGEATREIQQRRGTIDDMQPEGDSIAISGTTPVAEMFGFASAIRGATQGRALWSTENSGFEEVPKELLDKTVRGVRERKGLKPEPYDANYYAD